MKFNRLGAFTLGVVITAVSVGAVSFVNAAGDKTLKACANKTTGVMRYISKGSCNKKTETSLSWNQMGPSGLPGAAGTNGTAGEIGPQGKVGETGQNGKTLTVVDATGKQIGLVVGGGEVAPRFLTLIDGRLWYLDSSKFWVQGSGYVGGLYYSDTGCTMRLGVVSSSAPPLSQLTFGNFEDTVGLGDENTVYVASDIYMQRTDMTKPVYRGTTGGLCVLQTLQQLRDELSTETGLVNLQKIVAPTYKAPLTIVAK